MARERRNVSEEAAPRAHVRTPETDEVLRRIGRNVVIFQQVEHLLKFLNAHSAVIGPASQLSARVEKQVAAVHKNTLGELAGKLVNNILQPPAEHESPDEIDEVWFGFRFSVGADAEFVDRHDQEMRALVDARNDLIHHFLPRWQSSVCGDTESALTYLDAQRAEAVRMMDRIVARVERDEGWKSLTAAARPEAEHTASGAIASASRQVAQTIGAKAIAAFSHSGSTALRVARERPDCPVIGFTPMLSTARRLALVWGVHAAVIPEMHSMTETVAKATSIARREDFAERGDEIVVVAGVPFGRPGTTNALRVATVAGRTTTTSEPA